MCEDCRWRRGYGSWIDWDFFLSLRSPDDSAADLVAGVAGGLAGEIVGHAVNDHGSAQNVVHEETLIITYQISISLAAKKRRQVSGVLGMGQIAGIVVVSGLPEGPGAVAVLMDMHAVKTAGTRDIDTGKPKDLGFYEHAAVRGLIEFYRACQLRLGSIPLHPRDGSGICMGQKVLKM